MEFSGERFIPGSFEDDEIEIEHLQRYNSICKYTKNKIVVDAACGEGYGTFLISKFASKVFGIDISQETIEHAKEKYKGDNISFLCTSITSIPVNDNSVDIVISFETIEHVNEELQKEFLKEVKRILKKDGVLIISTPNKKIYSDLYNYKNEFHIKEFYEDEFKSFLYSCFKEIVIYEQRFEVTSVLGNKKSKKYTAVQIEGKEEKNAKYFIAVCSNEKISNNLDLESIVLEKSNKFIELNKRIIEIQEEIEKLSEWGISQDKEIEKRDEIINAQNQRIEELSAWGIDQDKEMAKRDNIILSQNQRIEELSTWGISQDNDLKKKDELILSQNNEIEKLKLEIIELKTAIDEISTCKDSAMEENNLLKEELYYFRELKIEEILAQLDETKDSLNSSSETILNQQGHIELLLEQERKLNNIYTSKGWKLLQLLYKSEELILPQKSIRRQYIKIIYKILKSIKSIIKNISNKNIKKFVSYIKKHGFSDACKKVFNYLDMHKALEIKPLQIFKSTGEYKKIIFPKVDKPDVSIIIPVYNQWDYTYSCLESIYTNTEDVKYEVIVADDVSKDETVNIKEYVENIRLVRNKENKGFLLNCNNAAKYAKGKYILFLNNDTNVQKDWLKYLIDLIGSDAKIGLVGSKLVYADGRLQEAGGIIWNDASGWNYGRLDDTEKSEYNYVKDVDYISGAGIMIRTELWKRIGGFDERYAPAYFEDSDLAFEVRKHGYKVVFQPKSVIVHFEGISNGTDVNSGIKSYQVKNKDKFIEKWKDVLQNEQYDNAQNVFAARDRSRNKKTILVIDHYVPHYDKDAGSRTTYQYLKLFVNMGYNVKFLGDNFFRHEPYTSELQSLGIEVLYGVWYRDNWMKWLKDNAENINFIYLNRPHISIKYIDFIRENTSAKIIYYGHDLHFLREQREFLITGDRNLLKSSEEWKKTELELISKSDTSYYPSEVEVTEIHKYLRDVNIKAIPAYIFYNNINVNINIEKTKDLIFVGGFGHKPNIDAVIWFLESIFPVVIEKIPGVKFYIVGSNPPEEISRLMSENVIVTGFVSDNELEKLYSNSRLVVVPLRYGAGVKGKVVEAMYFGKPIITTSVGAEGLPDCTDCLCIEDEYTKFAQRIVDVYNNKEYIKELSLKSKSYIENYFSEGAAKRIIEADFQ